MTYTTSINNTLSLLQPNYINHNKFEKLQSTQAKKLSTNFGTIIRAAGKKISSIFTDDEIKVSNIDNYEVSLNSGKVGLVTQEIVKNLILPPTFSVEFNGKSIEPKSNIIKDEVVKAVSFRLGKWNVSLKGDELTFKTRDTDETFILKHAVHVKFHRSPPKLLEDGGFESSPRTLFSDKFITYPAKVISKSEQSGLLEKSFPPVPMTRRVTATEDSIYELTDEPNIFGRMKLKFPMIASLKGAQQKISSENLEDTFIIDYTVDIQANKNKLPGSSKNGIADSKKDITSKVGILRMQLQSGDLFIEANSGQRVFIRHEVNIEIDLDSKVPSILISPGIRRNIYKD
ncbi:uncharacterized protein LOC122850644 [Aphidius gifuensis]|nr:uncharacterized protein LOC122850644 [Aphidius gifuensis]